MGSGGGLLASRRLRLWLVIEEGSDVKGDSDVAGQGVRAAGVAAFEAAAVLLPVGRGMLAVSALCLLASPRSSNAALLEKESAGCGVYLENLFVIV